MLCTIEFQASVFLGHQSPHEEMESDFQLGKAGKYMKGNLDESQQPPVKGVGLVLFPPHTSSALGLLVSCGKYKSLSTGLPAFPVAPSELA